MEPEPIVKVPIQKMVEKFSTVYVFELTSHHEVHESFSDDIIVALNLDSSCLCHEVTDLFLWKIAVVSLEILGVDVLTKVLNVLQVLLCAEPDGFFMQTGAEEKKQC